MFLPFRCHSRCVDLRARDMLIRIGADLHQHVFPRVRDGGIVVPSERAASPIMGTEKNHGRETKRRSAVGARQRAIGRQGSPGGARPPGASAPVVRSDLHVQVEAQLSGLQENYPGTQLWRQDSGVWLLIPSRLLAGLDRHVVFAVAIQYTTALIRSWGFWRSIVVPPSWIGPRHTNCPDGSICAFDVFDGTWTWDTPLVVLLDIYSVWAFRHLHFETVGRWPGMHRAHLRGEKLLEFALDEYCGCQNGTQPYSACCMPKEQTDRMHRSLQFSWLGGNSRSAPAEVTRFVSQQANPPKVEQLFPSLLDWASSQWRGEASLVATR